MDTTQHKADDAQEKAVEQARIAQNEVQTKALMDALKSVFGDGDNKDPEHMKILVRRIPILCTNIEAMHESIEKIENNLSWAVKIVLGAVILALLALLTK